MRNMVYPRTQQTGITGQGEVSEGGLRDHRPLANLFYLGELFRVQQVLNGLHRDYIAWSRLRIEWSAHAGKSVVLLRVRVGMFQKLPQGYLERFGEFIETIQGDVSGLTLNVSDKRSVQLALRG
jgi:hypothetical protein